MCVCNHWTWVDNRTDAVDRLLMLFRDHALVVLFDILRGGGGFIVLLVYLFHFQFVLNWRNWLSEDRSFTPGDPCDVMMQMQCFISFRFPSKLNI